MLGKVVEVLRVPELRQKTLFTLGLLFVYRLGFHVPLPGVNLDALAALQEGQGDLFAAFGILNALSGGAIGSCSLFTLGVRPYISASAVTGTVRPSMVTSPSASTRTSITFATTSRSTAPEAWIET